MYRRVYGTKCFFSSTSKLSFEKKKQKAIERATRGRVLPDDDDDRVETQPTRDLSDARTPTPRAETPNTPRAGSAAGRAASPRDRAETPNTPRAGSAAGGAASPHDRAETPGTPRPASATRRSATPRDDGDAGAASPPADRPSSAPSARRTGDRVFRYGGERTQPRAADRDWARWENRVDEETRRRVEEIRRLEREREERDRLAEEELEKLQEEILLIESIDEHIEENATDHHTDEFACTDAEETDGNPQLVVRRGQEFLLTLTFKNRDYDPEIDDLQIYFTTGDNPRGNKGTSSRIKLREDDKTRYMEGERRSFGARIKESGDKSLTIQVYSPPDAVIGLWEYVVWTVKEETGDKYEFSSKQDFVILLNPWCPDDQVYMEDTDDLKEYILNQSGSVFSGSGGSIRSKPWNYGHFQRGVLEICLDLLRDSNDGEVTGKMADPVFISRALSRILNSSDDNGVLTGRWDGEYSDGVRPLTWKGSPNILKQYRDTGVPVKYGQCWVFSHLLTTVARALGLPCRSVTNFASAHDTEGSCTIDKYFDSEGDPVEHKNYDSVWNFHVWNEVWMHRPDLDRVFKAEGKYDGWQAVDATPQETSEGVYQCGPSPLAAIKLGEVQVGYDTTFIFGEVNSDYCKWEDTWPPTLLNRDKTRVGKKMSTKFPDGGKYKKYPGWDKPGDNSRLDVTNLYKADEGSAAERTAVETAIGHGKYADALTENQTGIELSFVEEPNPTAGEDFEVKVKAENTSDEPRVLTRMDMCVRPCTYFGSTIGREKIVIGQWRDVEVPAGGSTEFEVQVKARRYMDLCDDAVSMMVLCMARVQGFKEPVLFDNDITCQVIDVELDGPGEVKRGDMCEVTVTYKNPLEVPLTKCQLKVDGSIFLDNEDFTLLYDAIYVKQMDDLAPGATESVTLQVKPNPKPLKTDRREFNVTLASQEMPDMDENFSINLIEP